MRTYSQMRKRLRLLVDEHNASIPLAESKPFRDKKTLCTKSFLYKPSKAAAPRITQSEINTAETLIEILFAQNKRVHNPTDIGKTWLNIFTKSLAKATGASQRTMQRHLLKLTTAGIISDKIVCKAVFFNRKWHYDPTEILLNKRITGDIKGEKVTIDNQPVKGTNLTSSREIELTENYTLANELEASDSISKSDFSNTATQKKAVTNSLNSKFSSSEKTNNFSGAENFVKSAKDLLWQHWEYLTENQYQALLTAFDSMQWRYGCTPAEALAAMRRTRNRQRNSPDRSCKMVSPTKYFGTASDQNKFTFERSLEIYRNRTHRDSRLNGTYRRGVNNEADVKHGATKSLGDSLKNYQQLLQR